VAHLNLSGARAIGPIGRSPAQFAETLRLEPTNSKDLTPVWLLVTTAPCTCESANVPTMFAAAAELALVAVVTVVAVVALSA
jgi:hypothetical protein